MPRVLIVLIAAAEKTGATGERAAADASGFEWQGLAVVGALAAVISLGYWLLRRWRMTRARRLENSPAHLLKELCNRHGLGRTAQRILAELAREQGLEHPAVLMVDPRLWEVSRQGALGKRHAAELDRLREQIFGTGR
jgi:hypothetical protein